jgi:pyoverdine/dityrosine biosynthesis protein Dit1
VLDSFHAITAAEPILETRRFLYLYCLQVIHWDHHRTRPTRDHFVPKSKKKLPDGAKTTFVICCQPCDSRKSDKIFSSIEEAREFIMSRRKLTRTDN